MGVACGTIVGNKQRKNKRKKPTPSEDYQNLKTDLAGLGDAGAIQMDVNGLVVKWFED